MILAALCAWNDAHDDHLKSRFQRDSGRIIITKEDVVSLYKTQQNKNFVEFGAEETKHALRYHTVQHEPVLFCPGVCML